MAASALRADSTFSLTLPRPHLIILYHIVCKNIAYFQIIFPVGLPSWSTRASMIKYRVKLLCNFRQCFHVVQISSQVGQIERWGQFFICAAGRWEGRAGGHRWLAPWHHLPPDINWIALGVSVSMFLTYPPFYLNILYIASYPCGWYAVENVCNMLGTKYCIVCLISNCWWPLVGIKPGDTHHGHKAAALRGLQHYCPRYCTVLFVFCLKVCIVVHCLGQWVPDIRSHRAPAAPTVQPTSPDHRGLVPRLGLQQPPA